jgi:hypothetical protein
MSNTINKIPRYYLLCQYNKDNKYCGHRYVELPAGMKLSDYLSEYEDFYQIAKEQFDTEPVFYKFTIQPDTKIVKELATVKRNWTQVGVNYSHGKRPMISKAIDHMKWQVVLCDMAFAPGEGIKVAIQQFKIPKVSQVAFSQELAPYGLLGIQGHYKNGVARIYILDAGERLIPICSDIYRKEGSI